MEKKTKRKPREPKDQNTVNSYVELAKVLGVTRQTLHRWSKVDGSPTSSSDGRHSISEWRTFMASNDLSGRSHDIDSLKSRDLLAKCEERELKNAIRRGEFVSVEEVRTVWTSLISQSLQMLEKALLDELPPILAGKEPIEIRNELEAALNEVRRLVHKGEGLTP